MRFAEVAHHWPEMLAAQLGVLYLLGLYETRALVNPRDHLAPIGGRGGCRRCSWSRSTSSARISRSRAPFSSCTPR
jgi:hypothetical protein